MFQFSNKRLVSKRILNCPKSKPNLAEFTSDIMKADAKVHLTGIKALINRLSGVL